MPVIISSSRVRRTAAFVGLASALTLSGIALAPTPMAAPAPPPSYLFTAEAANGATSPLASRGSTERFTLTLHDVDPVTMFTDRPLRNAKIISPAALDKHWETWFASSPPNAVLTWDAGAGKPPASFVVSLKNPHYDARTDTITFTAERIKRDHDPVEKGKNWARHTTPKVFRSASLFIDNASAVTVNGCTITSGASCPGADLSGANLSFLTIQNANFAGAVMHNVKATGTAFIGSDLSGVDFTGTDLSQTGFYGGSLAGAKASGMNMNGITLNVDDMTGADFSQSYMPSLEGNYYPFAGANFSGAILTNASFENSDLSGANFSGADLSKADLMGASLSGANLMGAAVGNLSNAATDYYTICPDGSHGPCTPVPIQVPDINDRQEPPNGNECEGTRLNVSTGKWENYWVPC